MTSRERLLATLRGEIPDCVPVAPDFSNMIPCRLTGKPFWQLSLYRDPPVWEAYIAAARHFDIDSLMDGYFPLQFPDEIPPDEGWRTFIVHRTPERIVTQQSRVDGGRREWSPRVVVYPVADPPTHNVKPETVGLPDLPTRWEPLDGQKDYDRSPAGLRRAKQLMGDQGLVGVFVTSTVVLGNADAIYDYYDNPEKYEQMAATRVQQAQRRMTNILALPPEDRPDFICVGGSGTLVFQTEDILRKVALPAVKRAIELATAAGIPSHVHSCGPETRLVEIMAQETSLTVIDPLEIPPMGDCNLADLKRRFGQKLTLKGNLHTTEVMLRGTPNTVRQAARQAIDDAAAGGRFILSTGDQCGRDTPDENLRAMIDTARTYGRYK